MENYNRYIKLKLGEKRIINWINFLHFIKEESNRSLNKLINDTNYNLNIYDEKIKNNEYNKQPNNQYTIDVNLKKSEKKNQIENDRINNINNEKLDHTQINNSLFGIINIGLTCYINSVIQIILHSELFLEKFLEKSQIITKNKNSTSFYIYKILCNIFKNKNLKVIDIRDFIHFFKNFHPIFGGINQCDALEFLRVLLEDISTELNEVKKSKNHILLDNDNSKTKKHYVKNKRKIFWRKNHQ